MRIGFQHNRRPDFRRSLGRLGAALLLAGASLAGAASERVWTQSEAAVQAQSARALPLATRLNKAFADEHPGRSAQAIKALLAAGDLDPVARESLLYAAALKLAQQQPAAETRLVLEALAIRPPQIRVWLEEEGHHRTAVPEFNTGAAARWALNEWQRQTARREAAGQIAAGYLDPAAFAATPVRRAGLADALTDASPSRLAGLRDSFLQALEAGLGLDEAAGILAARLADPGLFAALVRHGDRAAVLRALPRVGASLPAPEAFALLREVAAEPYLASAALYEIAGLAPAEPRVLPYLYQLLGEPDRGGAAAAALGGLRDPAVVATLGAWLQPKQPPLRLKHMVLALRLDGSAGARQHLDALAAHPDLDPIWRKELGL